MSCSADGIRWQSVSSEQSQPDTLSHDLARSEFCNLFSLSQGITTMYSVNGETFACYTVACMIASMHGLCVVEIGTGKTLWKPLRRAK